MCTRERFKVIKMVQWVIFSKYSGLHVINNNELRKCTLSVQAKVVVNVKVWVVTCGGLYGPNRQLQIVQQRS